MNQMQMKWKYTLGVLFALLLIICLWSLTGGLVSISPREVFQTLMGNGTMQQELILFEIRLPSIVLAILVGIAMAVSGAILQCITQNELAEPGILGINSGAGLAVVLYITFFQATTAPLSVSDAFLLPIFAFSGALLTATLIAVLAWKRGFQSIRLILVGIGINAGLSAILIALQLRLSPQDFMEALVWLSGDLWATQWQYIWTIIPLLLILVSIAFSKARTLNVLNLGSQVAIGLGVRLNRDRLILILLAVAMAGLGVAAGGGVAFLGLIAPHIARRIVGPRHQVLLPTAALMGSIILLLADTLGKNLLLPTELPAGIVVSMLSAPYFIYLLMKTK